MRILKYIFRLLAAIMFSVLVFLHATLYKLPLSDDRFASYVLIGSLVIFILLMILRIDFLSLKKIFRWLAILYPTLLITALVIVQQSANSIPRPDPGLLAFGAALAFIFTGMFTLAGVFFSLIFMFISKRLAR